MDITAAIVIYESYRISKGPLYDPIHIGTCRHPEVSPEMTVVNTEDNNTRPNVLTVSCRLQKNSDEHHNILCITIAISLRNFYSENFEKTDAVISMVNNQYTILSHTIVASSLNEILRFHRNDTPHTTFPRHKQTVNQHQEYTDDNYPYLARSICSNRLKYTLYNY